MLISHQSFFPSNHEHVQNGIVSANMFAGEDDLEHWLPMFLSISYWKGITLPKQNPPEILRKNTNTSTSRNYSKNSISGTGESIDDADEIAEKLNIPMGTVKSKNSTLKYPNGNS